MKTSLLLVGLLVTTVAAAQIRTAPPAAAAVPRGAKQVSPLAHVGNATAVDPQIELVRKQITLLKQQQSQQHNEITRLQTCVRELVRAIQSSRSPGRSAGRLDSSPGTLAGTSAVGAPMDNSPGLLKSTTAGKPMADQHGISDHPGKLAPIPANANLTSCD